MSDKYYEIKENAVYDPKVRALRDADLASAEQTFNPLFLKVLENTHAVKRKTDSLEDWSEETVKKIGVLENRSKDVLDKIEALADNLDGVDSTNIFMTDGSSIETAILEKASKKDMAAALATKADLTDGQVSIEQIPKLDYDPKGSASTVQANLNSHGSDTNLHVTAEKQAAWNNAVTLANAAVPASEKGVKNGIAQLDNDGKVPSAQLPNLDYDPKGSASAVQTNLNTHGSDTNLHVTAEKQTSWNSAFTLAKAAVPASEKGAKNGIAQLDNDGKVPPAQLPDLSYDAKGSAAAVQTNLNTHTAREDNPHKVTKSLIGLGNVDNTKDADKPISTATQASLNTISTTASNAKSTADAALARSGGTMTGRLTAYSQAVYTTKMVRNVIMRTSSSTSGITSGDVLHVYE